MANWIRTKCGDATDSTPIPQGVASNDPRYITTAAAATCASIIIYVSEAVIPYCWCPPGAFSKLQFEHAIDQIRRPLLPFPRQKCRPRSDRPPRIERLTVSEFARPPPARPLLNRLAGI